MGQIREKEKAAKDLETRAADIDAAVFDLKAVNPNAVTKIDARTQTKLFQAFESQGKIVSGGFIKIKKTAQSN